jgi:tetratricopeptide (TPR) repeat protein
LLAAGRPAHYPAPIGAVVRSSLDRLRVANRHAAAAAELFAALAPGSVPLTLLSNGLAGEAPGELSAVLRNGVQRGQVVALLTRFGLVRLHDEERLEVEPVLRLALRDVLPPDALDEAHRTAHAVLAAADPGWPDDAFAADMHRELGVHVWPAGLIDSPLRPAREALYHQIRYRFLIGDYREACELAEGAVERWRSETFLGPDDPLVLQATRQWANALRARGQYEKAWSLTSDGLSRLRSHPDYGDDHPQTLEMRSSHAADLRIAGEYQRALDAAGDIYERYRNRFGEEDGQTIASRHNLAVSHRLLGAFAVAKDYDEVTLRQHRERRGDTDWRTTLSVNALGEDLYGLGRYPDVRTLLTGTVEGRTPSSEPLDLGLLLAARTAALARRGLGEVQAARQQLAEHYRRCGRLFGEEHEWTLSARMSYANTLLQDGDLEGAHRHAEAVSADYRRILGPRNPLSLVASVNLAAVLRRKGDHGQARGLDAVASEALRDVLGLMHPFTVAAMIGLASDYAGTSRSASAVAISARAHDAASNARGDSHPDTLVAAANLILDQAATGYGGTASRLRRELLTRIEQTLGTAHPMIEAVHEQVRIECPVEPPSA